MAAVGPYLLLLVVAAGFSYAVTPLVIPLSRKLGAVDVPDDRKVHAAPTPSLGGVALFVGFLAAFIVAARMDQFAPSFRPFFVFPPNEPLAIAIGATFLLIVGMVDDIKGVSAPARLAAQIAAGGFVFLSGVRLEFIRWPLGTDAVVLSQDISAIATILWIVLIVNAVNLIDGLDGLAAGITAIAAGSFFIYTFQVNQGLAEGELLEQNAPLIAIIVVGATLGFLRYNFNPAKIFMGDSGAYVLGFLLAVATVVGIGRSAQNPIPESLLFYLPLAIPLLVLAIPLLDTTLAVVRRARRGRHVFQADKEHLHHRLLELGHGHRQAVLIMYAWVAILAGTTLTLSFVPSTAFRLVFGVAALAAFLYTVLPLVVRPRM